MRLVKYKNPTEYSFLCWMDSNPESAHPYDKQKFLEFARNVCAFNAKNWRDTEKLKKRILQIKPNFDTRWLQDLLGIFDYLLEFHKVKPYPRSWQIEDGKEKKNYYLERSIKGGKKHEKFLPL